MNPEFPRHQTPSTEAAVQPAKRWHVPNVFGCAFTGFAILVLLAMIFPGGSHIQTRGVQIRSLAQAKQIGMALKLFADDHDGNYPRQGIPAEMTKTPANSNAVFAPLFPTYTTSEKIFGNKLSAYQVQGPDDVIDKAETWPPVKTLEAGENVYAYVAGLTDKSDPSTPLVLDGTDGSHLYYNSNRAKLGGVWEGKKAVVIYLDNHAALETLTGPENARYLPVNLPGRPSNLLDLSWVGKDVRLLDPAVPKP